jgi:hypothetical protein
MEDESARESGNGRAGNGDAFDLLRASISKIEKTDLLRDYYERIPFRRENSFEQQMQFILSGWYVRSFPGLHGKRRSVFKQGWVRVAVHNRRRLLHHTGNRTGNTRYRYRFGTL